ncbi:MAG: YlbF family regulator [Gemmatimonadaceae bacterium]|nr:YlbF family regulator [Gemmatimonadaceae bacterium]
MIDQKARELGRLIGQSDEYKALKRANDGLGQDREAVASLQRMETLRREAQRMLQAGEDPTPEMEQELDGLLSRVQVAPAYQQAIVAQENFDKVMMQVNQWIAEGIKTGAASPIITLS